MTAASWRVGSAGAARMGLLMAVAGAVGFSGKAIIAKLAYRYGVDAITLVMYRMLFALPLFVALAWWAGRGQPPLTRRDAVAVGGLGFSGYYLASTLDFAGLQYISASLERLILYLNPTLVLLYGVLRFGHRVARAQWAALGLSYAGIVLAFGHEWWVGGSGFGPGGGGAAAWGALLVFGSAVSYALYLVHSGQEVRRLGALRLTGWATSVACVLCLLQFLLLRPMSAAVVAPEVLWLSLLNATLCTFAPVLLVMLAIERVGAGVTSQAGMVGPLSTLLLGAWLLDEPLNAWIGAGTGLVLLGVWLLSRPGSVSPPSPARP
jgi:drug/metabolite transporter (DMT)-like permease